MQCTIVSDTDGSFLFTSNLIGVGFKISCFSVYRCHGNINFSLKYSISNFNPIPICGVNFTSIRVRKVCKTAIENVRYGPEKNCIETPLNQFSLYLNTTNFNIQRRGNCPREIPSQRN